MSRQKERKRILFISSTGGHLDELMELRPLFEKFDYLLVTEETKINKILQEKYNIRFLLYGARNYPIRFIFKFIFNIIKSLFIFLKFYPDFVITTGVHTSVPMCYLAKLFGKKVIYIESFCKIESPTMSGKMIYPIADLFLVQWENMKRFYPKSIYKGGLF